MRRLLRNTCALLLGLVLWLPLHAQVPPDTARTAGEVDTDIEDAISGLETDDQTDWTFYTDQLEDFRRRPLDLNTASREELLMLPGMTEILVNSLQNYIGEYGSLRSLYELQAVPGFTYAVFTRIQPFVTVKDAGAKDMSGILHPQGPSLVTAFTESKRDLILRDVFDAEQEKGYTAPDTNPDGSLTSRYAGNRHRQYLRFRMRYAQNLSLAFVAEKDAGEALVWDPSRKLYGPDFLSAHVFLRDYGHMKRLAVGDFTVQCGQGMLMSSGLGFGKGSEAVNAIKRPDYGIRPFSSVNENQYLRGLGTTWAWGKFYATGVASYTNLDASLKAAQDTLNDEQALVSTLQTSGLHRTESEMNGRRALGEFLTLGRVEYRSRRLRVGTTHIWQQFSRSIAAGTRDYQRYDFTGDHNLLNGVDFDFTVRNFNFFGEAGRSLSGGTGVILGALGSIDKRVDVALLVRNFDRDFHSTRGYIFGERPMDVQNERGVYLGMKAYLTSKWMLSGFVDSYQFPWHSYSASFPSQGREELLQLDFKPNRNLGVYLRYRHEQKEVNASEFPEGQQLDYLVPATRQSLRLHFDTKLSRDISIRSRIERSWYRKAEGELETGLVLYQDLSWKVSRRWKFTGRYAVMDCPDYNARIYAYENDVLGFFSIPAYYGTGSRWYALVDWEPVRGLECWVRVARSQFAWEKTLGSGLTEVQGNRRTEIKLQVRYSF